MDKYDYKFVGLQKLAQSFTDGIADDKYYLWVPDFLQDAEDKEYLVLINIGDRINKEFQIVHQFKMEYIRNKCSFAISRDGKTVVVGYATKKGVICYDCESGKVLWNNPNIKKIEKVRFNNFEPDIIEVLSDKLEFTYLDKHTGQVLEGEKAKKVRQVINWMRASKNGRYLLTADTLSSKDKANYTVYDTQNGAVKGRFVAQSQVYEKTFDITDDGEFAVASAYQRLGISLIKVSTGEVLWTQKKTKKIHKVYFDKAEEKVVVCCRYDGIYYLNVQSGEIEKHESGEKIHLNAYGEDIFFPKEKIVRIGECSIESPGFSWFSAIGTKEGILLQSAGEGGLMLYDRDGKLLWNNKELFGTVVYQEDKDRICVKNGDDHVEKITIASAIDGQIIDSIKIPEYACAFIHNNKTLLCNTGKMYDVSNVSIKEIEVPFEFVVGTVL